jgi:hypothetical protein
MQRKKREKKNKKKGRDRESLKTERKKEEGEKS